MTGRAIAETFAALLLALLFSIVGAVLLGLSDGTDAAGAFLDIGPRLVLGVLWPTLILWTALVLIGNIKNRRRGSGTKFLTGVMSTIATCLVTPVGWLVFSLFAGDWGVLLFAVALAPTVIFFVAALVALALVHLVFLRRRAATAVVD